MLTLYIIVSTFLILFLSYSLGMSLIKILNINLNGILAIPLGFFSLLGINQFFIYFFVLFKLPSIFFFINYIVICILIIWFGITRIKWHFPKSKEILFIGLAFCYVLFMIYQSTQRTLGSNGFDTVHYLSMVMEGASQGFFSYVQYDNGLSTSGVNVQYDYQSYYYFGSMLVYFYDRLNQWINPYYFDLSSSLFIWISSAVYFTINFLMTFELLKLTFKRNRMLTLALGIFILLFTSNFYYTNVFTFFGNTFRTLILVFMYMLSFAFMSDKLKWFEFSIIFMLISSALISVSSSGFFIGAMSLFGIVMILIRYYSDIKLGRTIVLMSLPTLFFAIFYLSGNNTSLLIKYSLIVIVMVGLLLAFDYSPKPFQDAFKWFLRNIVFFLLPLIIIVLALFLRFNGVKATHTFFENHKRYDMVWYYFDLEFLPFLINIIWFSALVPFVSLAKTKIAVFIRILLITFINPISYVFVYQYLASVVYYRAYELIFNSFTLVIMLTFSFMLIKSKIFRKYLSIGIAFFTLIISLIQVNAFYNPIFIADESFSALYKLDKAQVEPLQVLKTKIKLESYSNPVVISQIEPIRGFVDVYTPIANETIRGLDKFKTVPETSKLLNIFVNRDHYGQMIFDVEPDYENTCKYLIEVKADFVIVDKSAYYEIATEQFEPLYFRVRECGTSIFENDKYALYQFYW